MGQYIYNIFLIMSQLTSTILGGHPDTSMSQRTAQAYLAHKSKGTLKEKWFTFQLKIIDSFFWNKYWKIEENHCLNSLEGESNAKEMWDWKK